MKFDVNVRTIRTLVCVTGFFFAAGDALKDYRDYRQAGPSPIPISITEASAVYAATPFVRKWVSLTEPLELDCAQALEQTDDGKVTATVILAFDAEKQHAFLLDYEEKFSNCEEARGRSLVGMLDAPLTKYWTTNGKTVPSTPNPFMHLRVGWNPEKLLQGAQVEGSVALILAIFLFVLWKFPGKHSRPVQPQETPFCASSTSSVGASLLNQAFSCYFLPGLVSCG